MEIREALRKMKANKSHGHDGTPSFTVKGCEPILTPILRQHIFKLCIESGVFPTLWKQSIVAQLFNPFAVHCWAMPDAAVAVRSLGHPTWVFEVKFHGFSHKWGKGPAI